VKIVDRGVLNPSAPDGPRSVSVCPTITLLRDGSLLATYVIGASKDDDGQTLELRRSTDGGRTWGDPSAPFSTVFGGRRGSLGAGYITQLEGDRLVLDLGDQRVLTLQIRVGGSPLRAAAGTFAQVDLRTRGLQARREIIAIRLAENDGILSVRETGREPIAVKVPLFQLTARQVGKPEAGTMPVEIRVGSESKVLAQGQSAEFPDGRLTVLLESSTAVTGAAAAADAEGPPFAMRLMAWPTP